MQRRGRVVGEMVEAQRERIVEAVQGSADAFTATTQSLAAEVNRTTAMAQIRLEVPGNSLMILLKGFACACEAQTYELLGVECSHQSSRILFAKKHSNVTIISSKG